MGLNERKLRILQAIVSDFIQTGEPVGSRTLSRKFDMGVSPATIRNEMADLEEMGFLTHPHTSAGRIPSDKGYRLYVNNLMEKYELPEEEKEIIARKLTSNFTELEETIKKAAGLLSEITNLTSFALTPTQDEDLLKYINILPVDERTVVLMIVSESGRVSNTALRLDVPYTEENIHLLSKTLTYHYRGKTVSEVLESDIIRNFETDIEALSKLAANIMPNFMKTLESMLNADLYMAGQTNIFSIPEFNDIDRAKMFLEMLSKKDDLTRTLVNRENGVIITIGDENSGEILPECSLITATYHIDGKLVGKVGVIGPTRMRYDEITSIVEFVTEKLNSAFQLPGGEEQKKG